MNVHYGGETLEVHPVADLFPMLADDELQELAEDIKQRGLLQAIVLDTEGRVLDGRNRLAACELAGVEPTFEKYEGDDPDGYALTVNMARRNLTKGQMAAIATQSFATKDWGSGVRISGLLGVSETVLSKVRTIWKHAPDLGEQVAAGIAHVDEAYPEALQRKRAARDREEKLTRITAANPDMAVLVREKRLSLDQAIAAIEDDERKAREAAEAARVDAAREAERRRLEAGDQATVEAIDKIRDGDGAPPPSFAQRAKSGVLTWKQAAVEAERWVRDRTDAIDRDCQRLRNIASGWGVIRTILSNREGAFVASIFETLGEADRRVITGIVNDLSEGAGDG